MVFCSCDYMESLSYLDTCTGNGAPKTLKLNKNSQNYESKLTVALFSMKLSRERTESNRANLNFKT